ncbi:MAG: hypothetical protein QOG99_1720 [Frankiales bacterium]|jgi:hypothetical protein|nr:hypothetical protein [Frankiales bacterium]
MRAVIELFEHPYGILTVTPSRPDGILTAS